MKRITAIASTFCVMMTMVACDSAQHGGENPLLGEWNTPYGVPPFDKIRTEHFMPAFEQGMSLHNAEIEAIITNNDEPTFENVIVAYDSAGQLLSQVENIFDMLCSAEKTPEMQAVLEEVMPMLAAHYDRIGMNADLFQKVKTVYDMRQNLELDAEQMRLLEKIYKRFVRSGALLEGADKERLQEINAELSRLDVKFAANVLAENNRFALELSEKDLTGIPNTTCDLAREKARSMGKSGYVFTLHKPSMLPFLTYSSRRDLREKLYKGYLNRGNNNDEFDNKQIINDYARLRVEKAHLLGFDCYADYVVDNQMAGTTQAVYNYLEEIFERALARANREMEDMKPLFEKDHPGEEFASWDWWYYAEKVRKQQYSLDEEMLRPYFSLENVQSGIFFLANRLYGISFRPVSLPVYHPEVTAFEVLDADETHLGVLYFDFFPRETKSQGAWCGNYVEQGFKDGVRTAPVTSIVCNFTRPTNNAPALLSLDESETLFHEFGHALHNLFRTVRYNGLKGVEGDFVELPSQIMENWAFEPEMLRQYAVHYRSGEVIPDYLIEKMRRSQYFNRGFGTTELTAAALSDMDIHAMKTYEPFDVNAFEHYALNEKRGLMEQIAPRYHYTYFHHIFDGGYTSGYYFYIWAEVLDKDAFEAFRESGDIFNREIAERFRRKVLERGGSAPGMTLYHDFRGKDPDKMPMLIGRGLVERPAEEQPAVADDEPAPLPAPIPAK